MSEDGTEGPQFLKQKYNLHNTAEVHTAVDRLESRTGERVPQDPLVRIQKYLDRIDRIIDPEPSSNPRVDTEARRERNINMLRQGMYDAFVIKPDEIPEGYFDNQLRLAREQGHGDVDLTQEARDQLTEVIIADQESSLDTWIDYLTSDDALYPNWLKYWAIRNVVGMGEYDKEKKAFSKRSKGTTKPFPDLNREALAYVLDAVEKKHKGSDINFAGIEPEDQLRLEILLQGESFPKLYAWAIDQVTPATEEELSKVEGQWVKYPQNSDHMPLVASLQGHGTGWCTAGESTAHTELQGGDFYVYYSYDQGGQPTVPRAAIRMQEGSIAEVRGVAAEQNLDPHVAPVVQEKLHEFPDGKAYEKKAADMRQLTSIEHKSTHGEALTKDDLVFLYEIDSTIEGFGYQKDPRVEEIRNARNPREDAPILFECRPDQIAWRQEDVRDDTKAYVGPLFPGIFDRLRNVDHLYTSFPEGRIERETLTIGGKTADELEKAIKADDIQISNNAQGMLESPEFETQEEPEDVDLVRLSVGDLGFTRSVTTEQLYACLEEYGLELVPAEVGPHYRIAHKGQPKNDWIYIGMKPITYSGSPLLFAVEHINSHGRWLSTSWANPDYLWYTYNGFVFRHRKLET